MDPGRAGAGPDAGGRKVALREVGPPRFDLDLDERTLRSARELEERAGTLASLVRGAGSVLVVSHIDADGITSAAVASTACDRAGVKNTVKFVKQLDDRVIGEVRDLDPPLVWFTDLGSGVRDRLGGIPAVVTDHHIPSVTQEDVPPEARGDLMRLARVLDEKRSGGVAESGGGAGDGPPRGDGGGGGGAAFAELNPHHAGLDGSTTLSGAGAAYLVARAMDPANADLAAIAVVGAVGDLQDSGPCKLTGVNRLVMKDGVEAGTLEVHRDLRAFGRETRPLYLMLRYCSDPAIPGLTGDEEACIAFLQGLDVPLKRGERWLSWSALSLEHRRKIASALTVHMIKRGVGHRLARRLLGEVYTITAEEPGTEMRDAKEYSTLLNSCGRYDKAPIGLAVVKGDRGEALDAAKRLLGGHRRNLVETLEVVRESGIQERGGLQYFDGKDRVLDSVVGIVAGMILGSGEMGVDTGRPLFGFADASDEPGMVKVSGRTTRRLVEGGVNLGEVMARVAGELEGVGGGHNIAAGAKVPRGKEMEFLDRVGALLADRLR